jgi:signal transduction histidine kinase/CheY-like chemotaxis protein
MTCSSTRGTAAEPVVGLHPAGQLLIDTYETPGAESLLRLGRERHSVATPARRLLLTEAGAAVVFVIAAGLLAGLSPSPRALSVSALVVTLVSYLIAARVQYPVGSSWTAPTQLVFVPMLFVLPTPWVPLIVAACSVAGQVPAAFQRRLACTRLLARVGDSFYALGPALVLVVFHGQTFSWNNWPLLLSAFGAQIAFDAGAGLGRTWFAERIPPCVQLPMVWLYATDACLSCIGLLVAASAVVRPGLVLLALPLDGLLAMLARERRQRLEYSLALSTAYRETTALLAQSQGLTQELERRSEALRETNEALAEKARLLSEQNRDIEVKNDEIELARRGLEDKATQLALSSKYKSEFLANMSHELRTPLNSMLILSRLLAENESGSLAEREVEFARTIHSAGDDLLALINDILDLSKVEAGRMELDLAAVALSDLCQDAERAFGPYAEQKGLSFGVEIDPALPASIVSDAQRLGQILKNLLSNAFKFTHDGGVTLSIGLSRGPVASGDSSLRGAASLICFTVTDTGAGSAEDKLNLIFEAFQQADGTTSRKYGGTGLGLSISRELAHLLGGDLRVQSEPGEGSRFSLRLPLGADLAGPTLDGGGEVTQPARLAEAPLRGRKVLVIDDDVRTGFALTAMLEQYGMKVVYAENGHEGVERLSQHADTDLVLLDIMMPGMDGYETAQTIRSIPRFALLPIITLTAKAMQRDREKALAAGASDYIAKPVDVDQLLAMMRAWLNAGP